MKFSDKTSVLIDQKNCKMHDENKELSKQSRLLFTS